MDPLVRAVEREGRHRDIEGVAAVGHHLVRADHDPDGVVSGVPLSYSKVSPGRSWGCWPTTPSPAHLVHAAERIGDAPIAPHQPHGLAAVVLDANEIGPKNWCSSGEERFSRKTGRRSR